MLLYFLGTAVWAGVFIAYMQTNKSDSNLWEKSYGDLVWKETWVVLCVIGSIFWPLAILVLSIYKLAFKFLNRSK